MPRTDPTWLLRRPPEGFYTSHVEAPEVLPVRTFLPTAYEPNYPYPLLVFLHGHGGSEEQVLRLAPRVSRRNFIAIGLRGPVPMGERPDGRLSFGWRPDGEFDARTEDYVFHAITQTRRTYHVHSERIFLVGVCEGATLAYRLGLTFPERLGGIIALNGTMPRRGGPLFRLPAIRSLKMFIGHGIANAVVPLTMARRDGRLLYNAGLDVAFNTYPTTNRLHPHMLRDVNRWVMEQVTAEE